MELNCSDNKKKEKKKTARRNDITPRYNARLFFIFFYGASEFQVGFKK